MEVLYNFKEVKSFALIGLHNLLSSANRDNINLKTFDMFLDPLEKVHKKEEVVEYAEKLKSREEK